MGDSYGIDAYAPDGETLWWHLTATPGQRRRFGGERRLAAYLYFNLAVGSTFTMAGLRRALGPDDQLEEQEQLNRRLRKLREQEWVITSYKDANLPNNTYRLDRIGRRLWLGEGIRSTAVSAKVRREVLDRDGSRCKVCGIGQGESYPGSISTKAKLTVGHRKPQERGGSNDPSNLRAECSRCNEPLRHIVRDPDSAEEVWARVRELSRTDSRTLLSWLTSGERPLSAVDVAHDRVRDLPFDEQEEIASRLQKKVE